MPALATAFFVMPYIEVGKSRRYADRRVGLSVTMLFIAFMLVSNWMGSPEYRVEGSPEQEVAQDLIPQEGHSDVLAVPYDDLEDGTYEPGQVVDGNAPLTQALAEFEAAMNRRSCNVNGDRWDDDCKITQEGEHTRYSNSFASEAMPDPEAYLVVEQEQQNMKKLSLRFTVLDPNDSSNVLVDAERVAYRHADSGYEEE
jgi:hypothetical protein